MSQSRKTSELRTALAALKAGFVTLAILSAAINILLLGGSLYLMLIYDAVLPSRSIPTLLGLLAMVFIVYVFQAAFEGFRSRTLARMSARLTRALSPRIRELLSTMSLRKQSAQDGDGLAPLRDFDALRSFIGSTAPGAFMDLPWVIFFLGVLTFLHPWLGLTGLVGAAVMIALAYVSVRAAATAGEDLTRLTGQRFAVADQNRRHAELIRALGMEQRMGARWDTANAELIGAQDRLTDTSALYGSIARVFRMFLQSLMLTVGALLVIAGEASGGVIFAASILAARALAPIDQVIGQLKPFSAARKAFTRLERILSELPAENPRTLRLEAPTETLAVEGLTLLPPGSTSPIVQGVSLQLAAGDVLGIVGMSGAGKTSLVKALVGIWTPARGAVRLDRAELSQWDADVLGAHLGYLPQAVELLPGTIAENIARFAETIDSAAVIAAARAARVHDMIVALPDGYETRIAEVTGVLSAGQRQRVALARALYGDPFLTVLDEPNSNLDAEGEAALDQAIAAIRDRQGIAVIVAHRRSAMARATHLLVMRDGRAERFGPASEVIRSFPQGVSAAASAENGDGQPSTPTAEAAR